MAGLPIFKLIRGGWPRPTGAAHSRPAWATPSFQTDLSALQAKYNAAVEGLKKNQRPVFRHPSAVLIEGATYSGVWLESGPQEGLLYAPFDPAIAVSNHRVFFDLQRGDGYLPCCVRFDRMESSQIQTVVPIAATALEVAERLQDEDLLNQAYHACSAWDGWLMRYRNTRGTGLCEAFCGFDTGEDKSARFKGLPWKCPEDDARLCPRAGKLPYLAPDLSATVYGGRLALASMARRLGKQTEAEQWHAKAESIRRAILKWCFDPQDLCFYDRDRDDHLVRIRCVELLVTLGEHVPNRKLFEEIYHRHVRNRREFWTPFPFPSVAADDPAFDHTLPHDSWGGPSQVLTALRAPRWMEYYGKFADLTHLMMQWVKASLASPHFEQQLDPWTGQPSTGHSYSPGMLLVTDFVSRLYGVRQANGLIEWNCRLPRGAKESRFLLPTRRGTAELVTRAAGPAAGQPRGGKAPSAFAASSELILAGKKLLRVRGSVRVVTDPQGALVRLVGAEPSAQQITLDWPGGHGAEFSLRPDELATLSPGA
jgi:hypothetical protein